MAPLLIAHRTCPLEAPENSLAGLAEAARQAADGVEIDLRVSLDQRPFLMHDNNMRRTTGWPLPLELTPSPLVRRQRLGGSSETVPSLDEALDALPQRLFLAVDVKTPWAVVPLVSAIKRRHLQSRVLVWCTSALAARFAVTRAPAVEVAYLKSAIRPDARRAFLSKALRLGCRAVSASWYAIDAAFVAEAHALGLRVYSFDEGQPLTPDKLTSGLDGLITDRIHEARALLQSLTVPPASA